MSLALPIPANRRGACPTLHEPMQTGDGLLARLRVKDGRLTPAQLAAVATLAAEHGNGLVEITARGNLQVRGLTPLSSGPLAQAIESLVPIERGLVVETPPLAGDDPAELANPRPLADAIRALPLPLDRLGPKVTVTVDGNGQLGLAGLKADVAILAVSADQWLITVAGFSYGPATATAASAHCADLLTDIANLGRSARATDLSAMLVRRRLGAPVTAGRNAPDSATAPVGRFAAASGRATGIALPFGSVDHAMLTALAAAAIGHGIPEFRLAPHHALLAIGAPAAFTADAAALAFITSPTDPRTRISACIGSAGCASGHIPARALAARLASALPPGTHLHVSGCAKGCAHPRRADLTLVGMAAGTGLVIGGRAGDTPTMILTDGQTESAIVRAGQPA